MNSEELQELFDKALADKQPELVEQLFNRNALLYKLQKHKGISFTSGDPIVETISYQTNPNVSSYAGYDALPTAADDGPTASQYAVKQYAVPIAFSGYDAMQNAGEQQATDLLNAKIETAFDALGTLLCQHVYQDGTGNRSKDIDGLAAMVSTELNTYGGIDRKLESNAFWRNQVFKRPAFTVLQRLAHVFDTRSGLSIGARIQRAFGKNVACVSTIQKEWNSFVIQCTRGKERPDLILCSGDVYALFDSSLRSEQRHDLADAGFCALKFQGIDVVFDSGVPEGTAYFLNTKFIKFRTHKKRNFSSVPASSMPNMAAFVQMLLWAGNLTCTNAKLQGVWRNV